MPSLTRDERLERQKRDNGDPGDTVWYTPKWGPYKGGSVYHESPDCSYFGQGNPKETTRDGAQRRWLAPCTRCVLDSETEQ